jgi:anti-sigma-K factor RskA
MVLPHPAHVIMNLEERQAEFLAEAAREQRARLAEGHASTRSRQRWLDLAATAVVVIALALLVAAGAAAAEEAPLAVMSFTQITVP